MNSDRLEPADYGWTRGRHPDAGPAERKAFADVMAWSRSCRDAAIGDIKAALAGLGRPAPAGSLIVGPLACRQASALPQFDASRSFAEFARAEAEARPVADAFIAATRLVGASAGSGIDRLPDRLRTRALQDQMLRHGANWGEGPLREASRLSADALQILRARLWAEIMAVDAGNTAWLKQVIDRYGWPSRSQVGEAAGSVWLLVQHADHDPLFQLSALRLMEPLVGKGEVSGRDYAYLYDRVMLKLAGKQRYGTQFICRQGKRVPLPLEDEASVARRRAEAGLETLELNSARMQEMYGNCPPA